MGAPSKEEIAAWTAEVVKEARRHVAYYAAHSAMGAKSADRGSQVILALADEVERLRAERAEMLAMLESWDIGGRPVEGTHALVAKLRGAP